MVRSFLIIDGCFTKKSNMAQKNSQRIGETVWAKMPRLNAEVFTLTYGSLVMQLLKDFDDVSLVNEQLEKMGHNIGKSLIIVSFAIACYNKF